MASTVIPHEKAIIENGWNCLLIGLHGTGKSAAIRSIADRHGFKVAIYNTATMDPHTELLGIPMPRTLTIYDGKTGEQVTREVLKMIRPDQIDGCEIVFLDELNRSPVEVQNACMELANERTINGEPLPNLKCVFAAINPPDGDYHVSVLDPAFIDRFDIYVDVEPNADPEIMHKYDGITKPVAEALVKWWKEQDHHKRGTYLSPRRLAKLGKVFEATKSKKMMAAALPPGTTAELGKLFALCMQAAGTPLPENAADAKLASQGEAKPAATGNASKASWLQPKHGGSPVLLSRAGQVSVDDLEAQMQAWSQPSRSRFRTAFRQVVTLRPDLAQKEWANVVEAVNRWSQGEHKIEIPAS
jgi:MoxR-like ATPase